MFIVGNLVTPRWWTDLWLNEGFATYVSYLGVEAVQPDLNFLDQFVAKFWTPFGSLGMHEVLGIDALATSHPISIPVQHPDEIAEIFDTISYVKGKHHTKSGYSTLFYNNIFYLCIYIYIHTYAFIFLYP